MAHLTAMLYRIHGKSKYFKGLYPKRQFPAELLPIVNKYPNWVKTYRDYANFGKFVDYTVRKMIQNIFGDRVVCMETQAEKIDQELNHVHWVKTNAEGIAWTKSYPNDEIYKVSDPVNFEKFVEHRKLRIAKYCNTSISWRECLADLYYLALLDGLYENKTRFKLNPKITPEKVRETLPYFESIAQWITVLLQDATKIYLNPSLFHQKTFGGDADLIAVFSEAVILYDMKVTWNSKKVIRAMYWQLLGYTAMHQYLLVHEKKNPICITGRITNVGFLLFNQLCVPMQSIEQWKDTKRLQFLQKLSKSTFWKKKKRHK